MRLFRSARWLLLALLLPLIPTSQARAGVFISVGFAPPVLPVYVQPPCPQPGFMWTPGYWAYGPDGYYWVPGAWVAAPYVGALWTPPYWGWQGGVYLFHVGYWGPHVGYYGGVNYGFGYGGIGFFGGEWRGHEFAYNTAVVNVNRTVIRNTYVNNTIVRNNTIVNNNRVAYSGGPGGVNHPPTAQEATYMHEAHTAPTAAQQAHVQAARADHTNYFNANHGQPQHAAMERPMTSAGVNNHVTANAGGRQGGVNAGANANGGARGQYHAPQQNQTRLAPNQANGYRPNGQQPGRMQPQGQNHPQQQPAYHAPQQQQPRPQAQPHPQQQPHPQPHASGPHGRGR